MAAATSCCFKCPPSNSRKLILTSQCERTTARQKTSRVPGMFPAPGIFKPDIFTTIRLAMICGLTLLNKHGFYCYLA